MQVANGNWPEGRRGPRQPDRWEEQQVVPSDRFVAFAEEIAVAVTSTRIRRQRASVSTG